MYSKELTEFILNHYWELKLGRMPQEASQFRSKKKSSPQSQALIWTSDIDQGIDRLNQRSPGKWLKVVDIITPTRLQDIVKSFSRWQQAILRYYLLGWEVSPNITYESRERLKEKALWNLRQRIDKEQENVET